LTASGDAPNLRAMLSPNPWMILPFALLLLSMAALPVLAAGWWQRHYPKVVSALGLVTIGYYLLILRATPRVLETAGDFFSFIVLVGSLFTIAGGLYIRVTGGATPLKNVVFLAVGALAGNVLGVTGASLLLIRPWIQINRHRISAYHIVFFIFIVANAGGCLVPTGPPLYLGFLQGVPFWWTAERCWPMWAVCVGMLLAIFYAVDRFHFNRAPLAVRDAESEPETWKFDGLFNLAFAGVALGAVFLDHPRFLREALMMGAAVASYFITPKRIHAANNFDFHPLREVAILFAGIFATMIPALDWLAQNAASVVGQHPAPGIFYWGSGILSAILDNAPTYLGFLNALAGLDGGRDIAGLVSQHPAELAAISVGSVIFGAGTYIGNNPNFMIKAIAEREKIPMPGFVGYIVRFAIPFLLPVLAIVWLLFFR
jgi:Na+/H+ antiporter NhaD/arsenite permease-like protein